MSKWSIGTPLDALHKSFFDRSEKHRRWRLDRDIAWGDQAPTVSADLVTLAETFWAVESFLPDYTTEIARAFRGDRGRVWVHAMWAYEESKHARAFEEWLLRGGHRSAEQLNQLSDTMWEGTWTMPQDTDRKMLIYQMLQEGLTRSVYSRFRRLATDAGDKALADVLRHLTSDEQAHYVFFRDCVRLWLEEDREGTVEDMYSVLIGFSMPAGDFIPDYPRRDGLLTSLGVATPYVFLTKVWLPTAEAMGVDPLPPILRPLRDAGHSVEEIAGMLLNAVGTSAAGGA